MKKRTLFGAKSYFAKMVLWMSMAFLLIVVVLSIVVYMNAYTLLIKKDYDANKRILFQVKYNIKLMDRTISSLSEFLYLNSDVSAIMYAKQNDMVDVAIRLNKIVSSITSANPYVHSISIYNRNLDQFYSVGAPLFLEDQLLLDFFNSNQALPKLKPIFRDIKKVINGNIEPEPIFSYFMYETTMNGDKPDGAVVVNVKPEWLLENIKQINMIDRQKGDRLFVMDQKGEYLDDGTDRQDITRWLKNEFMQYKTAQPLYNPDGFFQSRYKGTPFLVTYAHIDSLGLTLLKIQPVLEVYKYINSFKTSIISITFIFLLMAFIISFLISQRIYQPLGKLVNLIATDRVRRLDKDAVVEEISYLDYVYRQSMEKLDLYDKERYHYKDVMKHYWLKRLLTENLAINRLELENIFIEMRITLPLDGPYMVILLKIDKYKDFQQTFTARDKETIRFALINIASEIVARKYPNEGLDMKDDHVVLIVQIPSEDELFESDLLSLMKEAQEYVARFYKVSFTVSISDIATEMKALYTLYNKALDQAVYRFIQGHASMITSESIKNNIECTRTGYARNLEERFLEMIHLRNSVAIEEGLTSIFAEAAALSYHDALFSIIRLVQAVKETLEEIKVAPSLLIDFSSISRNIIEIETLAEIRIIILSALNASLQKNQGESENALNYYIVGAVTEYIHNYFHDPSLCLTSIASLMKISSRRLSKLFKESTQISIPDFINEVRLKKAAELLVHEALSIHEVVEKVGILNETYFFSLFKKRFGVTPKEYVLQKNATKLN